MFCIAWLKLLPLIIWFVTILVANPLVLHFSRATFDTVNGSHEALRDNVSLILRKDISRDILAASVPVTVTSHNERINSPKGFLLRSSSHNISGVGGYSLFALPIISSEFTEILNTAEADLLSRDGRGSTLIYRVNTTKWSFSVVAPNTSIPYASIKTVLQRFIRLSTAVPGSDVIVTTRVGVLINEGTPVADINISPCQVLTNGSFVPFVGFEHGKNISTSKPVEVVKITPFGSTCIYELINETAALSPFRNNSPENNLGTRQLGGEILAHVGQAAFAMTVNLWRRRDGLPVEVKIWALKAIIHIGYWQFVATALLTTLDLSVTGTEDLIRGVFDAKIGLDTGIYVIGRMMARFVVKIVQTAKDHRYGFFTLESWKQIFGVFFKPLEEMGEYDNGWAMDGVIYKPGMNHNSSNNSIGESGDYDKNVMAVWQIWIGDSDDFDY